MRGGHLSSRSETDDAERHPSDQLRTALFVDFDNIFIALRDQDEQAADRFRSNPGEWVRWLERQLPEDYGELTGAVRRRILIRRVYANPRTIGSYRPHFVRAGFEVIDTPPLTSQGKTSADIHMVIDMLDALAHSTHFDEFLICSGDADFTPVLLRLRKCDRRTAVLSIGPAAGAYTAACDLSISEDTFLDEALLPDFDTSGRRSRTRSRRPRGGAAAETDGRREVLLRIEERLFEEVGLRGGVEAHELIGIYKDFPAFTAGQNWLEFYSLRAMTEAVVGSRDRLEIIDDDQWWVGLVESEVDGEPDAPSTERDDEVAEQVRRRIGEADHPVSLAAVGQGLMSDLGEWVKGRWQRAGSLKTYLEELDLGGLEIAAVGPGWLFDPERHQAPEQGGDGGGPRHGDLPEIGRKVCNLTDTPPLTSEEYGVLLRELEKEVNENGYHISQTSKAVRDRLNGKGLRIARSQVSFILKGLAYSGFRFVQGEVSAYEVGDQLVNNTLHLLGRIQVSLDEEEKDELYDWMTSEIPPSPDDPEEWEDDTAWEGEDGEEADEDDEEFDEDFDDDDDDDLDDGEEFDDDEDRDDEEEFDDEDLDDEDDEDEDDETD